ncbi:hypothetical protein PVK06_034424 [Gossypium arboreum]|uniref:Uncharacterized protein n=1 Tax=Gossypium arboreum TaxID=29729 RepID=A0ABR0NE68_GOSAR|nr:hypothetical protein PVK06_034424 [Gossypium arboreum]
MVDLFTTLWNYWNNRNNFIFKGQADKAQTICDRASNLSNDFCIYNLLNLPLRGGGGFIDGRISVQEAKCIALERSIEVAGQLNIHDDVLFETGNVG